MRVMVEYFAVLRERRGLSSEEVETQARTPRELYRELGSFGLDERLVRASVGDEFVSMDYELQDGDRVVFIPPVAGG